MIRVTSIDEDKDETKLNESEIKFLAMLEFGREMKKIREALPEFALEIDRCLYDVGQNHAPKCGEANCVCHWSFEQYHAQQNIHFGTQSEAKSFELIKS